MKKTVGHVFRICGLLIEMFGVWGVFNSTGAKNSARLQLPGGDEIPLAWLAVGVGFVLWFTGTILVYFFRPTRKLRAPKFSEPLGEPPIERSS
jgi:uncharacterized BrkB/YihY/UPF0761 family membrane protein